MRHGPGRSLCSLSFSHTHTLLSADCPSPLASGSGSGSGSGSAQSPPRLVHGLFLCTSVSPPRSTRSPASRSAPMQDHVGHRHPLPQPLPKPTRDTAARLTTNALHVPIPMPATKATPAAALAPTVTRNTLVKHPDHDPYPVRLHAAHPHPQNVAPSRRRSSSRAMNDDRAGRELEVLLLLHPTSSAPPPPPPPPPPLPPLPPLPPTHLLASCHHGLCEVGACPVRLHPATPPHSELLLARAHLVVRSPRREVTSS